MKEDWQGLNLPDLIDLLEPVPEPAPISMVPQTVGWLWLGLGVLVVLGMIIWRIWTYRKTTAYRREALAELKLKSDPASIAHLLRRTALAAYPRVKVASLTGSDWLSFLDTSYGGTEFSNGPGRVIADSPYMRRVETQDLTSLARIWIKTHRKDAA
ncbi:MAG: DUF4381 domain-containing protein [Roseibium sp.]